MNSKRNRERKSSSKRLGKFGPRSFEREKVVIKRSNVFVVHFVLNPLFAYSFFPAHLLTSDAEFDTENAFIFLFPPNNIVQIFDNVVSREAARRVRDISGTAFN